MSAASGPSSPERLSSGRRSSGESSTGQSGAGQSGSSPTPSGSGQHSSGFTGARRRIPRYPVAIPVDVTVLRSGLPRSIPGRSLDIGEGGVAVVLAAELQTGEWVAVELQLPNIGYSLQTKAVVRHHNQLRCGFEFLGLSRDQRYMIRHWAGTSQPEQLSPESPAISSALAKLPSPAAGVVTHLPAEIPVRERINPRARQLLWLALALVGVAAIVSVWQWERGWQQLEAQTARKDAHARPPSARVPSDVMERLLVRKIDPVYPEAARRANVQGIVVLDAIIAADGAVVHLQPISGPEGLTSAAMDAVRWWRFRPYRAQGEPAPVETSLAIEFRP
jgi:TonB family protein